MKNFTLPDQDVLDHMQREHLSKELIARAPALSLLNHNLVVDWAQELLKSQKTAMIEAVERELARTEQ